MSQKNVFTRPSGPSLFSDTLTKSAVGISVAGLLLVWILYGIFFWQLPPEIPLWFSLPAGEQQLVSKSYFVTLPLLLTAMFTVNVFILRLGLKTTRVFNQMISWGTTLLLLLGLLALWHVIWLVF